MGARTDSLELTRNLGMNDHQKQFLPRIPNFQCISKLKHSGPMWLTIDRFPFEQLTNKEYMKGIPKLKFTYLPRFNLDADYVRRIKLNIILDLKVSKELEIQSQEFINSIEIPNSYNKNTFSMFLEKVFEDARHYFEKTNGFSVNILQLIYRDVYLQIAKTDDKLMRNFSSIFHKYIPEMLNETSYK